MSSEDKTAILQFYFASKPLYKIRELVLRNSIFIKSYIATFSTKPVVNVLLDDELVVDVPGDDGLEDLLDDLLDKVINGYEELLQYG